MNVGRLNRLIGKVQLIGNHLDKGQNDPLLSESLDDMILEIKNHYGSFLLERLFDIYDDYFPDSEMESIESYISKEGVEVEGDEFEETESIISIHPFPLRIEVHGVNNSFKEVLWQAA